MVQLDGMRGETPEPAACLGRYPEVFRKALEPGNRMCLCSFMGAEFDDLPEPVKGQVQIFADGAVPFDDVAEAERVLREMRR